jgi:F-type H+-transporting ATPase subunit epsilon
VAEDNDHIITVRIVTPDGVVYDHHARLLVVNAIDGELGIMANHEPIIAPLKIAEVRVERIDGPTHENHIAVNGGFMEFSNNVASIVADSAERQRNIDLSRAQRAKERAEKAIAAANAKHDTDQVKRASVALQRAVNRIQVKQK